MVYYPYDAHSPATDAYIGINHAHLTRAIEYALIVSAKHVGIRINWHREYNYKRTQPSLNDMTPAELSGVFRRTKISNLFWTKVR
jgi:ABC-type thiamine transport system substrate-binding protein